MNCPVCDGVGWLNAAPMMSNWRARNGVVPLWDLAVRVPCWACWPTNVKVMA